MREAGGQDKLTVLLCINLFPGYCTTISLNSLFVLTNCKMSVSFTGSISLSAIVTMTKTMVTMRPLSCFQCYYLLYTTYPCLFNC